MLQVCAIPEDKAYLKCQNVTQNSFEIENAGKVYTPTFLAQWVASLLIESFGAGEAFSALDPACGEGELLLAIKEASGNLAKLYGADIDVKAIEKASGKLKKGKFHHAEALIPENGKPVDAAWKNLTGKKKVDILIANPPWGADLLHDRATLLNAGYSVARGQFDSWDLFTELSLRIVKPGGLIGLIIPDAIFLPEHEPLRKILNTATTVLLVARLGEGFFENVYRGTTVVILKNETPSQNHRTEVFRLNKDWRNLIFTGRETLSQARKALSHKVKQSRFADDRHSSWDIDATEEETSIIKLLASSYEEWTKWLETGRGVELSKTGRVIVCPKCEWALPAPRTPRMIECDNCGHAAHSENAPLQEIVKRGWDQAEGWLPLIVGEDVDRYKAFPGRAIKAEVAGINYKSNEIYNRRRILIRKTGVGIKASIVDAGPMINQVVYHYYEKPNSQAPKFYLSYVLGVLCSRVLFAYHLRKNGENEWRSHPYLTQKLIGRLPVPLPRQGEQSWIQAKAIAEAVDKLLKEDGNDQKLDTKIECLVSGLFNLDKQEVSWVRNVIDSAQELEPMRGLKTINLAEIEAVYA